jgi:hypothetical protein
MFLLLAAVVAVLIHLEAARLVVQVAAHAMLTTALLRVQIQTLVAMEVMEVPQRGVHQVAVVVQQAQAQTQQQAQAEMVEQVTHLLPLTQI